jgi:thiol-disulfide isomerase/thioredoxin
MLMRSVRAHSETHRLVSMKLRHRTWLLLTCAAAFGLLVILLGVRVAVQRVPSQDMAPLAAVRITPVTPPKPIPSFGFADETGHSLSLADFRGRAVVLNLWATWCVPCRKEMPSLDRLQAKLGGPRFQVLAVSIDKQGAAVVQPFYRELGLRSLRIHLDPSGKAPSVLGIEGVPATLLIDTEGREIGRKLGALEWNSPAVIGALRQTFGLAEMTE